MSIYLENLARIIWVRISKIDGFVINPLYVEVCTLWDSKHGFSQ